MGLTFARFFCIVGPDFWLPDFAGRLVAEAAGGRRDEQLSLLRSSHLSDAVDCTKCQKHKVHKECFHAYKILFNAITAELQDDEILCTECFDTFQRPFCGNNKQSSREICQYPLDKPNENTICKQCHRAVHDECISRDEPLCHTCAYNNMVEAGIMEMMNDSELLR